MLMLIPVALILASLSVLIIIRTLIRNSRQNANQNANIGYPANIYLFKVAIATPAKGVKYAQS